jgi:hypothetical protein
VGGILPGPEAAILIMGQVAMNWRAYDRKVPNLNYEEERLWFEA